MQAYVASNIFWENHDQTNARNGFAIFSTNPEQGHPAEQPVLWQRLRRQQDVRHQRRPTTWATASVRGGTDEHDAGFPGELRRQPGLRLPDRPPARSRTARRTSSSTCELRADRQVGGDRQRLGSHGRSRPTSWATRRSRSTADGWGLAGYGPRDVGAFEFDGTGGITLGGAFRVVTTSLVPVGGARVWPAAPRS